MPRKLKISLPAKIIAIIFTASLLLMITYESLRNNIHEVIPNKVYRSAQLPKPIMKEFITLKHIRSVINLRGNNPSQLWYQNELEVTHKLGVRHYNIALNSKQLPTPQQLRYLINILKTAPRPLLIHCEGGADRTGLAAAFILIINGNASLTIAEKQFSWIYFVFSNNSVGKQVFPYYIRWLKNNNLKNSKTNLEKWSELSNPYTEAEKVQPKKGSLQ